MSGVECVEAATPTPSRVPRGKESADGGVFFRVLNFLQKIHHVDFHHVSTVFTHFFHVIH